MTAFSRFTFPGYSLRPAATADLPLAQEWTGLDKAHADVDPRFWIEQRPGHDAYVLEAAAAGFPARPLFFIKLVASGRQKIQLFIQFDTTESTGKREMAAALRAGLSWLEKALRLGGVAEILFRSGNPGLILFAQKRLGFTLDAVPCDGESLLRKDIALRQFAPGAEEK